MRKKGLIIQEWVVDLEDFNMNDVILLEEISKVFSLGEVKVRALNSVSLKIKKGEFVAIMGASGSGKSTLMNLIGCLDKPTSGKYLLDDVDTSKLSAIQYAEIRNQKIGFVFQGFNLLPKMTALENVELPLLYDRVHNIKNPEELAIKALEKVGLADRIHHEPNQLSGGQQQRVAIARSLINNPALILADEPTGNLDSRTSVEVFGLFQELNNQGITIVLVTHERDFAKYAKRIVELKDGNVYRDFILEKGLNAAEDLRKINESAVIEDNDFLSGEKTL